MFIDARTVPPGTKLRAAFCIIGGGPAGISIALTLEEAGFATILLEAGGLRFDAASQQLYRGDTEPPAYDIVHSRTRQFGGSSNCWGGWTRPFAPIDIQSRPWVPHSGWPISLAALSPYQARAHRLLNLEEACYSGAHWPAVAEQCGAPMFDLCGTQLENIISQLSPPTRFGRAYRERLGRSARCTAMVNAPVVELVPNPHCTHVEHAVVARPDGEPIRVEANAFILASGGIENARLLLNARRYSPRGLGNDHDMVGRFFMDHPRVRLAKLRLARRALPLSRYYDVSYYRGNRRFRRDAAATAASIGLGTDIQAQEELVQAHLGLIGNYVFDECSAVQAAKQIARRVVKKNAPAVPSRVLLQGAAAIPLAATTLLARRSRSRHLIRDFTIQVVIEPVPDPDNRITLGSGRDRLGLHPARVRWHISNQEKLSYFRCVQLFKDRIETARLGEVDLPDPKDITWETAAETTWHHMGTTRMSEDPRRGVVDADCRVHGISNLYIAGSSVFPTGGGNMPTINIVALALRLADHLIARAC